MNPLKWKREHQIALLIGAGIGLIFGLIFSLYVVTDRATEFDYWPGDGRLHSLHLYWLAVLIVALAGSAIGAAAVYAAQLMRR
jgi:hypothetical protein